MIVDFEIKIEKTLVELEKPFMVQDVFNQFIKIYPEDWKKHKIAYSKFNRSKQFGKTIPLPKPEVSLKKMIQTWINKKNRS